MGIFDSLIDFTAEVIASPVTLTAAAVDATIKTVEALPEVAEKTIEKVDRAISSIGD